MSPWTDNRCCGTPFLSSYDIKRPIDEKIRWFLARLGHSVALCKYMVEGRRDIANAYLGTPAPPLLSPRWLVQSDSILNPSVVRLPWVHSDVGMAIRFGSLLEGRHRGGDSSISCNCMNRLNPCTRFLLLLYSQGLWRHQFSMAREKAYAGM